MNARSNRRAVAAGLALRPLRETLTDILEQEPALTSTGTRSAGLTDQEELTLLETLRTEALSF
ncbi:hypothetical protein E8P82_03985 [Arthrobacter echini]|uniref:Uncharacterized protein n=1 Tax=Arthrobacter echini TaxID=1529066 RepID=A0A4V3Z5U5_9MICC|nr:hypothetical protein [Arthrobacter echini]THJ67989.1 hypothetical protein E8P82_03985 [Arthrobacter echini]